MKIYFHRVLPIDYFYQSAGIKNKEGYNLAAHENWTVVFKIVFTKYLVEVGKI